MTWETALGLGLALFVFCAIPGPGVLAVTARALSSGMKPAVGLAVGMTAGDLFYATAAMVGLTAIGRVMGEFFMIVRVAGAAYLIWTGCRLWRQSVGSIEPAVFQQGRGLGRDLASGFAISLGNPKVILFYLGFLPAFMDLGKLGLADVAVVAGLIMLVICGTLMLYAFAADRMRVFFRSPVIMKRVNRTAGAVLIGTGAYLAVE